MKKKKTFQYGSKTKLYPLDWNWFWTVLENHVSYRIMNNFLNNKTKIIKTGISLKIFHFSSHRNLFIIRCDK